jgi:predicted MPP superfamily phosphohydrolase
LLRSLDYYVLIAFAIVQFRITILLLRAARARLSKRALPAIYLLAIFGNALLIAAYTCTISELISRWRLRPVPANIVGALWIFYLMIAGVFVVVQMLVQLARKKLDPQVNPGRRRMLTSAATTAMAAPFAVIAYGALVERSSLRTIEHDLPVENLPRALDGFRILQVSDIHMGTFLDEQTFSRFIDQAVELRPDLAVVTGDLISVYGDPLEACMRQLARIKADAGVFGCLGNHERYADVEGRTSQLGAEAGIRFLRRQNHQLRFGDATLNIAGVDYEPSSQRAHYLRGAERLIVPGATNLLLSHNPDVLPAAAAKGFDAMLAGHTHGGQVAIEILDTAISPASFVTPFVYGLYRRGKMTGYVTRGIGTIGIPARIGAPPEIAVLRLRKA